MLLLLLLQNRNGNFFQNIENGLIAFWNQTLHLVGNNNDAYYNARSISGINDNE